MVNAHPPLVFVRVIPLALCPIIVGIPSNVVHEEPFIEAWVEHEGDPLCDHRYLRERVTTTDLVSGVTTTRLTPPVCTICGRIVGAADDVSPG